GKTTAALAFAHDLYGKNYQQFVLELNASDERGIDVIRGKIKEFARTSVVGGVPFKLIILDESDNLTSDAQQALRRMMENFTLTSRFILIANYPSKIIEPIQSRTALFRFSPLKKEDVIKRLKWILENESVSYEESALEAVFEISEGDMRKAINVLQSASAIGKVTVDTVYKVVGLAHPKEIREMLNLALSGDFNGARERLRKLMMDYGLSGVDVIKQIHKEIFSNEIDLSEEMKLMIADYTGEILFRITEGSDDEIQLNSFLAWLVLLRKRI
ncbi:MAG: replication factor C small subunit, partial [Fervidicoccus fontis]